MNLFKSKKNLLLLVSSVIVWLGTCLLAMHWNTVYDGAVGGFPTYLENKKINKQDFYEQQTQ